MNSRPRWRQAASDDLAVQDVESGEQGRRPVPFIVMRPLFGQARSQGRDRNGVI